MAKSVMRNNSDLKLRAEQVIDDAYMYGYEDGKKESTLHCWTKKEIEACNKEMYQRGYEDGVEHTAENFKYEISNTGLYQSGLNDAWECARKIYTMSSGEASRVFGEMTFDDLICVMSAQEAMQKIKDYERKQKWNEQVECVKENRDEIEKMLEEKYKNNCDSYKGLLEEADKLLKETDEERQTQNFCQYYEDGYCWTDEKCKYQSNDEVFCLKPTEKNCDNCEFSESQFNPCNECMDWSEYKEQNTKDDYVDAIVKVRVPKWQIGEKVNLYFKDTMSIDGICEADKK